MYSKNLRFCKGKYRENQIFASLLARSVGHRQFDNVTLDLMPGAPQKNCMRSQIFGKSDANEIGEMSKYPKSIGENFLQRESIS